MAEGKLTKRGVALIISIIIILSGIAVIVYAQLNDQSISVGVVDFNGNPIYNATIQGMILTPPSNGSILQTVFLRQTEHNGNAVVSNFTLLKRISNEWLKFYHGNLSNAGYLPDILLFVTYEYNGSLYFTTGSVLLTPKDILNGKSGSAVVMVKHDRMDHLVNETNVTPAIYVNSLENKIQNNIGSPLPNPLSWNGYFWAMQNNTFYPSGSGNLTQIPISWATFGGDAYGVLVSNMGSYSTINVGLAINPFSSSSVSYQTGGAIATISGYSGQTIVHVGKEYNEPSSAYTYVMGQLELATYRAYYVAHGSIIYLNNYIAVAALVNIGTSSSSISMGYGYGIPSILSKINNFTNYQFYNASLGTGNINPQYSISSLNLYQQTENYGPLVEEIITIGAIFASLAGVVYPPAAVLGISLSILRGIIGLISWQNTGSFLTVLDIFYDAPANETVDSYVLNTNVYYQINGQGSMQLPLLGAYIYTITPTSGGGCVVYGTNITLSNGEQIPVQDLKVGMKTLSYDPNTGEPITTTVSQIKVLNSSYIMIINGNIEVTGLNIQPIFVKFENGSVGWTMIGNLNYTMKLYSPLNNTWFP